MIKILCIFSTLAVALGIQLRHRHQTTQEATRTCEKSYTEIIRDGEISLAGKGANVTWSSARMREWWFYQKNTARSYQVDRRKDPNPWIQVTFPFEQTVSGITLAPRGCCNQYVTTYTLEYSSDGTTWTQYNDG